MFGVGPALRQSVDERAAQFRRSQRVSWKALCFAALCASGCSPGTPGASADAGVPSDSSIDSAPALDTIVLSHEAAASLFARGTVSLGEHIYVLPIDFTIDLGTTDLDISGVPGRTVITSYDGTAATDFSPTPLNTNLVDNNRDGLYVVTQHPSYAYGGGFAHLELPYETNGVRVFYTQGTILQKLNGTWSRHYAGAGFQTRGNVRVRGITFDNCQFYLFSPFGLEISERFIVEESRFNNVARVISSSLYGGVDHDPTWHNALNVYPVDGSFRFAEFTIRNNAFENIHTSIVWGFPPSQVTHIEGNTIGASHALCFFNLFMKNYADSHSFNDAPQFITGNTFTDIAQYNNWTTQLIRTSGTALIDQNHFTRITPQVALFYGGNTIFSNNVIEKLNSGDEIQSPVIVVKASTLPEMPSVTNTYAHNEVDAPHSFFVAVEGTSDNTIEDNVLRVQTVFSKNDEMQGLAQTAMIRRNTIVAPGMTNVGSSNPSTTFHSIGVVGNTIESLFILHTGSVPIDTYQLTGNQFIRSSFANEVPQAALFTSADNTISD